jgi:hypothetical protein
VCAGPRAPKIACRSAQLAAFAGTTEIMPGIVQGVVLITGGGRGIGAATARR